MVFMTDDYDDFEPADYWDDESADDEVDPDALLINEIAEQLHTVFCGVPLPGLPYSSDLLGNHEELAKQVLSVLRANNGARG